MSSISQTPEMDIIQDFMTEVLGDRWGENSERELTYLLSQIASFVDLSDPKAKPDLRFAEVDGQKVALAVYTLPNGKGGSH